MNAMVGPEEGIEHGRLLTQAGQFLARRILFPFLLFLLISGFSATALAGSYSHAHTQHVRQALLAKFHDWKGTPYRYGGMSHRGIDCSGFVHIIYRQALGLTVPRSTARLSRIRHRVPRHRLAAGDVILFRIGHRAMHAGIYVGHGRFIHASKSRGVMMSSLDNPYWKRVYSKAVRPIGQRSRS